MRRFDGLVAEVSRTRPMLSSGLVQLAQTGDEHFWALSEQLLEWAEKLLGPDHLATLARGYALFVLDVSKSQMRYERARRYENLTFEEAGRAVYFNEEFAADYHWGVYTTTFAWDHHVRLHRFFTEQFLPLLPATGSAIDLGSGSGVWSAMLAAALPGWRTLGLDISPHFAQRAEQLVAAAGLADRCHFEVADALAWQPAEPVDAGMTCFVLEHLEDPRLLLESLSRALVPRGHAFVTGALTAAESDHIFEFTRESELLLLAEECGLRVVASLSASPPNYPATMHYLPRSMAMIVQKRGGEIW